jgi:predicted enzyme related to lactoylglutathione lyase
MSTVKNRTPFHRAEPILSVADMSASVAYYVDVLGFVNAPWGDDAFTHVTRDDAGIYLCRGGQGHPGTWIWIGVADVEVLRDELRATGAKIRGEIVNHPWARELEVADPDGHVIRFGSEPV